MPDHQEHLSYRERLRLRLRRPIDVRARHVKLQSHALGITKSFYVALPPGYHRGSNVTRRYPVLYLFRGHEHEWIHRWQDRSRRGRSVIDVYRELLRDGKVGPIILVFPGTSSDDNRVPGMLVNFRRPDLVAGAPGVGTGRFEDYFLNDVIPYVDTQFRTVAERSGRAVDGFSLGGFQSIKIAAAHPHLFTSAGSFDGTFLYATDRGRSVRQADRVFRNPMFAPAFGDPRDIGHAVANSPANLIMRQDRSLLAGIQWMVRSGPAAAEPWQANYHRAQHLIQILADRRLENCVAPVLLGANHTWIWADRHMRDTLPLHWQALSSSADKFAEAV